MSRFLRAITLVAIPVLLSGCSTIKPPKGYVSTGEDYRYDLRAVSAQGNRFALSKRENPDPENGTLEFWGQALEYQKVERDGYRLQAREEIRLDSGKSGRLYELHIGSGAGEYTYLIGLFVHGTTIYTVEAGGLTSRLLPDREAIIAAIKTLRVM